MSIVAVASSICFYCQCF